MTTPEPDLFGPDASARLWGGAGPLDALSPDPAALDIAWIARSLARTPRYNGMSASVVSVADHLLLCDWLVDRVGPRYPAWNAGQSGKPPDLDREYVRKATLLHDLPEAYTGDLVEPLKSLGALRAFREIERRIHAAMCSRWLAATTERERRSARIAPQIVKEIDRRAFAIEVVSAFPPESFSHFAVDPDGLVEGGVDALREITSRLDRERSLLALAASLGIS